VQVGGDLMFRLQEMRPLMEQVQTGGLAEAKTKLATVAQGFGAPDNIVNGIANGNLPAAQEFQKFAVQAATENLKQLMTGATGKITNLEFSKFQDNNPHLDTDPRAIEKIFNFMTRTYQRDKTEQDALAGAVQQPGFNPLTWANTWQNMQQKQGIIRPEEVTGRAKGTSPAGTSRPSLDTFFK